MPQARTFDKRLLRGVYVAEWTGENGEMILVAVASDLRRIAERLVPFGAAAGPIADEFALGVAAALWELLDRVDPETPRLTLVRGGESRR